MPFYGKVTSVILEKLKDICGPSHVHTEEEFLEKYSRDETEDLSFRPEVVVTPTTASQVSDILLLANEYRIPVTPRGAGTGLSGGALPLYGGIVLSTEKMNRIIDIDEDNMQAMVEPGVINQVFREAVEARGLFYPPDPASRGSCFLGGNLAENAGGPKAVKYGVTKDYVLNCEVVLPTGEIIWTGANVLKNATGYNLTQLFIGSEGTLGIITKIVFRLLPRPAADLLLLVPFSSAQKACQAVCAVFREGIIPSALEFMEREALVMTMQYVDSPIHVPDHINAHLIVEVDGNDREMLLRDCEKITEIMYRYQCDEILLADNAVQKERLWKLRRSIGQSVKAQSVYREEDTVVPRARLPELLKGVKEIGQRYGFRSVCYGHAGDGNLHVNILRDNMTDEDWNKKVPEAIREMFRLCHQLGGTLSGEHGIGLVQKNYLPVVFNEKQIEIQKKIKSVLDPNFILNPGKIFPD
jgi:glycolate oxidase